MATQTPSASSRQSVRSQQEFMDLVAQVIADERDADRVADQLTRLGVPRTLDTEEAAWGEAAIVSATDFDSEHALAAGFVKFADRHVRKLKWHLSHAALDGVEAVSVLYRVLGDISQLRIARVVHLLTSKQVLTPHEWGLARELLNRTYRDFRQATALVATSWPEALIEATDREAARRALEHLPGLVRQQSVKLSALRERIEAARNALAVKPDGYPIVRPPRYFGGDLLDAVSWKHFWGEVHILADSLHQHVMS